MIVCGWCGHDADPARCARCGHDPALPYLQRGQPVPGTGGHETGRPALDESDIRRRYAEARADLSDSGLVVTIDALAERLDRSPRTVREWRKRYGLR